ncbi:MAG: FHA domain-containing protein [Actinomycetia bacterium]|nr:FHA domain-containing protein [Actinomycetes bacterium]
MPLKATYQGNSEVILDDVTALIGSDAASTIRIVRPGISRKHAVLSFDGSVWKIEDAGSRNGSYHNGQRIQILALEESTTIFLGHPTDGESLVLTPVDEEATGEASEPETPESEAPATSTDPQEEIDAFVLPVTPPPYLREPEPAADVTRVSQPETAPVARSATDADLIAVTAALRDQINAVKGLTWSVWAMIAVTAALAVMTLFVGILGN